MNESVAAVLEEYHEPTLNSTFAAFAEHYGANEGNRTNDRCETTNRKAFEIGYLIVTLV